jgi:hypothetical protein
VAKEFPCAFALNVGEGGIEAHLHPAASAELACAATITRVSS